jgi:hypothetical protein
MDWENGVDFGGQRGASERVGFKFWRRDSVMSWGADWHSLLFLGKSTYSPAFFFTSFPGRKQNYLTIDSKDILETSKSRVNFTFCSELF